ncbi:hypothetical protein J5O04_08255 [Corynebacterium hindlerae]|uniref:hypothetical protein n=1 Tax=Corynebacterium hindlerae TaxID=699041 RepID=UPI001AD6F0E7|nr:hypothetical protein [Corynebacterium hindlerae]QTH58827.1 hypothetical protein J5O04_08255 [Corynebacterium hindlerae]
MKKLKLTGAAFLVASAVMISPANAAEILTPGLESNSDVSPSQIFGKEKFVSSKFDNYFKCMAHRSGFSLLGKGVSLTCHRDWEGKWFYYWWNL